MEIKKCHICNADIFPGEKRCIIAIHIFPDQDDEIFLENFCPEDDCPMSECMEDVCGCSDDENMGEHFQEVHLVLCKDCQDQFLQNPTVQENLLFLRKESDIKTLH